MTTVRSFNHIAINVRDLEASLRFYEEGLGLRKTLVKAIGEDSWKLLRLPAKSTGRTAFLQGEGRDSGQIELVEWALPETAGTSAPRPGDIGPWVLSLTVEREKIDGLHDRLIGMGFDCYSRPVSNLIQNYGTVTMFMCEDPDGNQIELVCLPTREEVKAYRAANMPKDA